MYRRDLVLGSIVFAPAALVSGCSVFTRPTGQITIERQQFINVWAKTKVLFARWLEAARAVPGADQGRLNDLEAKTKALALEVDAKISTPEADINWELILKFLEFAAGTVL